MTSLDPASPFAAEEIESRTVRRRLSWQAVEAAIEHGGERLNPILVKEARQALKSSQFVITFTLLLLAGWIWSLLGVALLSPGVYYAPGGRFMLAGYFIVLTIPVLVNVPFSAFRSLASEREDGTFELLSITALSARQIVTGKLGSAVLQMMVYYSALAPCIAFTYLLRGIDIVTIAFLLFYTVVASVMLSALGLVVATVTRARHWQTLLSVLLLIGLLLATVLWIMIFAELLISVQATGFDDPDFWLAQASIVTFCISHTVLFVMIAAAQISFASDNRSTRLRVMLLVQQVLWIGWMMFYHRHYADQDMLYVMMSFGCIYWFIAGALMMGEAATLSPRVKRSLPQSFAGRMVFTWFNPGSGTGYTFAVCNILTLMLVALGAGLAGEIEGFRRPGGDFRWLLFATLAGAYAITYLGVGRLLVVLLGHLGRVTMLLTLLLNVLLVIVGVALPLFLQAWLEGYARLSYSALQLTNWAWSLEEVVGGTMSPVDGVPITVFLMAGILFLLNLLLAMAEVEQVRQETPDRVIRDDRELHPELSITPKPRSPWDED